MNKLGVKSLQKIYRDKEDGSIAHIGYIGAGEWFTIYEVNEWRGKVK
jgi:hypothetical protein